MPRRLRHTLQGTVFHVLNRGARRATLFHNECDYLAFLDVVREGLPRFNVKVIAYCLMPNHWHFVIQCERVAELSRMMHWVTGTHAQRWNVFHGTRGTGSVYQGRFSALPVETERYFIRLCRYVERNPLRAGLVAKAEDWKWSSLSPPRRNCSPFPLQPWPIPRPLNWSEIVNRPDTGDELKKIQEMMRRGLPIGSSRWQQAVAPFCGLSIKPIGRPRKDPRPRLTSDLSRGPK